MRLYVRPGYSPGQARFIITQSMQQLDLYLYWSFRRKINGIF